MSQYATLLLIIANCTGYVANQFNHYINDLHLYDRHEESLRELYKISSDRSLTDMDKFNKNTFVIFQENNEEYEKVDRLKKALEMFDKLTLDDFTVDDNNQIIFKDNTINLLMYQYQKDLKKIEVAI